VPKVAQEQERRGFIVTFRRKEERQAVDRDRDKLVTFSEIINRTDINFYSAESLYRGVTIPPRMPVTRVGYDVNRYSAPIVMATLTEEEVERLRASPSVEAVEDDGPTWALSSPGSGYFPRSGWGPGPIGPQGGGSSGRASGIRSPLLVEGQPSPLEETIPAGVAQIKAPLAWEHSQGRVIKVFILDTGIDDTHPDLAGNFKGGASFVPTESSTMDFNSHGTHCAGIVAAQINGLGVVGVAPAAYLYSVKVLDRMGSGQFSWIIAGIDWCIDQNGLKILSMSLGGAGGTTALEAICNEAYNQGCLLVAAAGNDGPNVPVLAPASYNSVIAVSAIDSTDIIAPFSNRGPEVELCAPGVNVVSTIRNGQHGTKSGTSMACPHVSGSAALAWGSHRYSNNVTIRRLLAWTADSLGRPGRSEEYGFGRVDAEEAAAEVVLPPPLPGIPDVAIY
jgi:subtilisin